MDYRDKLKKLRMAAGLTQGELNELADLNGLQVIKMAESKYQHLNGEQIEQISRALKIPVCEILPNGYGHK